MERWPGSSGAPSAPAGKGAVSAAIECCHYCGCCAVSIQRPDRSTRRRAPPGKELHQEKSHRMSGQRASQANVGQWSMTRDVDTKQSLRVEAGAWLSRDL